MRNLERCIKLDASTVHHALVAYDSVLGDEKGKEVIAKAKLYFKSVQTFTYGGYFGNPKWPRPQNYAWQNVARYFDTAGSTGKGWLWWESDASVEKAGCFDALFQAYQKGKRPFLGHVVEGRGYMNGVAIYPFDVSRYCSDGPFLVKDVPFDVQLSQSLRIGRPDSLVCQRNDLIHHIVKRNGGDAPSRVREIEEQTAVLIHGITHVVESNGEVTHQPKIVEEFPFQQQTKWPCGFYELSGNTKTTYFNPCIIDFKGRDYLFARRQRWLNPSTTKEASNDLAIFDVTDAPKVVSVPKMASLYAGEQWDDPRAVVVDGRVYVSFAKWFHRIDRTTYQSMMLLSEDWSTASVFLEPKFGGNGSSKKNGTRDEKNWVWFIYDGRWHCVYMTNPMIVYGIPKKGRGDRPETFKNKAVELPWKFGDPRGGTPPVLIGDEYVTFFHSSTPWVKPQLRYHLGAVTFESKPPFALKRICVKPLLSGSEHDPRMYGGPPCIFACGALHRNGEWIVTFGVNDENCGWMKIPHAELDALLVPIK